MTVKPIVVVSARIEPPIRFGAKAKVHVTMTDGSERLAFEYFSDELTFFPEEMFGRTLEECVNLFHVKDVAYLRS